MGTTGFDLTFAVDRLFPAVIALTCLVIVPTTAATLDGGLVDSLGQDTEVVLEPYDGPNGRQYVEIQDASQELTVNVTEHGVNTDAVTTFDDLFNITNTGDDPRQVWVTDSVSNESAVRVYTDDGTFIDDRASRVVLGAGETLTVGVRIDTYGGEIAVGQTLRFTVIVHVRFLADADDDDVPDRSDECVHQPEDFDGVEDDDGCPETNRFGGEETTVTFPESVHNETADRATVTALDLVPSSISSSIVDPDPSEQDRLVRQRPGLDADYYATPNAGTVLDGEAVLSSGLSGIEDRRMVKRVDVDVPPALVGESATVSMAVPRSELGDSDPGQARVARRVDGEWRLLETSVASLTPSTVTFEADTTGFGEFAVLAANGADYTWQVEGEARAFTGSRLTYDFPSEGIYEVSLTATDDFGTTGSATARVFVNAAPTASLDVVSKNDRRRRATLDAAVVDELGGGTVTWHFPDGTTATGERVAHTFDARRSTVQVTVEDVFGRSTATETAVTFAARSGGSDDDDETPTPTPEPTDTPTEGTTTEPPGDVPTEGTAQPTTTVAEEGVEIVVPEGSAGANGGISVQELELVEPGEGEGRSGPQAVITAGQQSGNASGTLEGDIAAASEADETTGALEGDISAANREETLDADIRSAIRSNPQLDAGIRRPTVEEVQRQLDRRNVDLLTETQRETNLVGTHSLFATKESIEDDKRMVRHVSISVPPELRDRATPIQLEVPTSRIGTTDPEAMTIAHHTVDGWQLLSTEVVDRSGETITVRATTPGFSRFAVFAQNSVTFTWEVETFDRTFEGQEINPTFDDPGIYNVTLTVEDAFGLTDRTDYRILANDAPRVAVSRTAIDRQNRTATFEAVVDDEVGNVTVTWAFPDGTTETGRRVRHEFSGENTTVEVYASDEYGALGTASTTVVFQESLVSFESGIPIELRHVVASWVVGLVAILLRWRLVWFVGGFFVDHTPEIVSVERPSLDRDRIVLDYLRIDDDLGDLTEVSLVVLTDTGEERARTRIECDKTERYERTDQVVWTEDLDAARETYVLRVEAVDDDGNEASAQRPVDAARAPAV